MYVIVIKTPANDNPQKMVNTFYVKKVVNKGVHYIDWDEDIKWAKVFTDKIEARKVQSYLRTLKGSEDCKIRLRQLFSKN